MIVFFAILIGLIVAFGGFALGDYLGTKRMQPFCRNNAELQIRLKDVRYDIFYVARNVNQILDELAEPSDLRHMPIVAVRGQLLHNIAANLDTYMLSEEYDNYVRNHPEPSGFPIPAHDSDSANSTV